MKARFRPWPAVATHDHEPGDWTWATKGHKDENGVLHLDRPATNIGVFAKAPDGTPATMVIDDHLIAVGVKPVGCHMTGNEESITISEPGLPWSLLDGQWVKA